MGMNKYCKSALAIVLSILLSTGAMAANVTLYALDGRSLVVDETVAPQYTAVGMGWYEQKPVTMFALDERSLTVAYNEVEAYKQVGWYLYNDLPADVKAKVTPPADTITTPEVLPTVTVPDASSDKTLVQYTDGTTVSVPTSQVEMYKALGWVVANQEEQFVTLYNEKGESIRVSLAEVSKYETAGWTKTNPNSKNVTAYSYDGTNISTTQIPEDKRNDYKNQGWYTTEEEAIYAYAAFGNAETEGATKLLENKKYELAFRLVQNAIEKIEGSDSEYVSMLYYLRSSITTAWREAANSPLGFINTWFSEKDGKSIVVFEYRNVSNSRIQSFRINFDICDKNGDVIETNSGSYYVNNLEMTPCDKKRVAWVIKSGDSAASITNLKVTEVVFSDGTKWTP